MLGDAKAKYMLRVDRIHTISEIEIAGIKTVVIHYETPDRADTEVFTILEDLHDIRRQFVHASLSIEDTGCGVPDSLPLPEDFFEKFGQRHSIRNTTGIESSPQFT